MPVTKTAIKNLRKTKRNTARNARFMTRVKGFVKEVMDSLKAGDKKKAKELQNKTVSYLDRAAKKNLIHPNKAARIKSKLAKQL